MIVGGPSLVLMYRSVGTMASAVTKEAIARVAKEIFGKVTGLQMYGKANGQRFLKQELTGVYLDRYYPESIETAARTVGIFY